jgi:CheY-like chemotaxis protein
MGHEVRFAINGYAALEVAERFRPQVVLLELGLPGLHGCEVARRLRQDPETRTARIIAVTGHDQEDDRRRSLEAGCDEHLRKPLEAAFLQRFTTES